MNANNSTETKSIISAIDSLFDVDAIIKSAGAFADDKDCGGTIGRVMRVASEKICAIARDLDVIDSENSQRASTLRLAGSKIDAATKYCDSNDITTTLTTISALAARAMDASGSDHDLLWAIEELSRSMKEKIEQADSIPVV